MLCSVLLPLSCQDLISKLSILSLNIAGVGVFHYWNFCLVCNLNFILKRITYVWLLFDCSKENIKSEDWIDFQGFCHLIIWIKSLNLSFLCHELCDAIFLHIFIGVNNCKTSSDIGKNICFSQLNQNIPPCPVWLEDSVSLININCDSTSFHDQKH